MLHNLYVFLKIQREERDFVLAVDPASGQARPPPYQEYQCTLLYG